MAQRLLKTPLLLLLLLLLLALAWPAVPSARASDAAAWLDAQSVPARQDGATLLHIAAPGRYALAAHSGSGASLQLVDQLAGPGQVAGIPGVQDGRVDALLDSGTYKLRVASADHAQGEVGLTATPFRDAAPPQTLAPDGQPVAASLGDMQQRRFWLVVPDGHVRIVASGRALADLRLWRDGRDLVEAPPQAQRTEPVRGHPMTELALAAEVEPGTYMVTAYGGEKLTWADGDQSNPFFLRAGARPELAGVWASGTIGKSGLEIFAVPDWAASLRLDLPKSAAVTLAMGDAQASIEARSREPWTVLALPPLHLTAQSPRVDLVRRSGVQLRGEAGQTYRLRVLGQIGGRDFAGPGDWWVSAATQGMGGDEVPPGLLLQRREDGSKARILADTLPHVGPGEAWRARFNLRGPTMLPLQADRGGQLALRTDGVALDRTVDPTSYYDVAADLLDLSLVPADGAAGALDVTFGPPGMVAGLARPYPPDPVIAFGEQLLAPRQSLVLDGPRAPGASFGLSARPVPVYLAQEPLVAAQLPGQMLRIPVSMGSQTVLEARAIGDPALIPVTVERSPDRCWAVIPAPSAPREIVLSYQPDPPAPLPQPAPRPAAALPRIEAGRPVFLTLADEAPRTLALHVAEGGLYQVETLGRLHTQESLGTPLIPTLATDDGSGPGHNGRLNPWLRAGDYRVTVTARDSDGHAGLLASPATLLSGPSLLPGGAARVTLPAGQGVRLPVEVAHAGRYRLTLSGQARRFQARLDDAEGWPLTAPGPFDARELVLQPGRYRLLVTPGPTEARMVARMDEVLPPRIITGHGPHELAAREMLTATWREPEAPDAPRTPDTYVFTLAGAAHAHLRLGEGMVGTLIPARGAPLRVGGAFDAELAPGAWRLEMRAEGRNDRLDYTVLLDTDELQPDRPWPAPLPSTHAFTIAQDRVVTLATDGPAPVRAVLRQAGGEVLARSDARADDWNTVLSRRLPAGRYTVELLPGAAPATLKIAADTAPAAPDAETQADNGDAPPVPDMGAPDMPQSAGAIPDAEGTRARPRTTLSLTLPPDLREAAAGEARTLDGSGVHILSVAQPPPGSLLVASARVTAGAGTAVLALERRDASGAWRQVTQSSGARPFAAAPADAAAEPWRVAVWALDPGMTLGVAVEVLTEAPSMRADMVAGLGLAVAKLDLSSPAISAVRGPPGLMQASWPGHPAVPLDAGRAVPQTATLWLVGPAAGPVSLSPSPGPWTLDLARGAHAALPSPQVLPEVLRAWRAESGDGQPVWSGAQDAVAPHSAVAVGAAPVLSAGDAASRVEVRQIDVPAPISRAMTGALSARLPPRTAQRFAVPGRGGDILVSLAPGMAAFLGGAGGGIWAPSLPVTRRVAAPATLLLVNLGDAPAAASVEPVPHVGPTILAAGQVFSAFHGAAGSFDLPADIPPDGHLALAGEGTLLVRDAAGRVLTGRDARPAPGRARVTVSYGPGASVLWLEAPGRSPWPVPAATPVQAPAALALRGPALALSVAAGRPVLLHASTTAPVLLGLGEATPDLFAAGAELHRAVRGDTILRLMPAQDGPLSGTLSLWTEPLRPAPEGVGPAVLVPPGGSAAFAFTLARASRIGLGVRADPDMATARLLDDAGHVVGEGTAQLRDLAAGRYVIEVRVPPEAAPTTVRPALLGTVPRPAGPPDDVARYYLDLAGLRSAKP